MKKTKFKLNGCDISFIAQAPKDITLEQLLKQCDRIVPDWCACGICSCEEDDKAEIDIDYNDIKKLDEDVSCRILKENFFVCEICGEETPIECEGSEPNTCAMCMPLPDNEFMGQN